MTYRVYFNRWKEFPLIWSVDNGTQETEQNVAEVIFDGVEGRTASGPGDNENSPTVWIEATGTLSVSGAVATIRRALQPRARNRSAHLNATARRSKQATA